MTDYEEMLEEISDTVDKELDRNLALLTDEDRLEWIGRLPKALVNDFVHLYNRAFLINEVLQKYGRPPSSKLEYWLDRQLMLRASADGKRTGELIQAMRIRAEAIDRDVNGVTPRAPDVQEKKAPRRLGF